jgi:zinc transport system substrate-binding protein
MLGMVLMVCHLTKIVCLVVCILGAGCNRGTSNAPRPKEKPTIVASVYPLADVARQIAGDTADVSWIVESGDSVAGLNPSANARSRMETAGILFVGGEAESWAVSGGSQYQHSHMVRLDALNMQTVQPQRGFLWLDPLVVADGAREVSARLQVLRSDQQQAIKARSDAFVQSIDAFMRKYQPALADAQTRKVLVLSSDFDPLLRRFSLTPVMTIAASPTRLTDSDIRIIRQMADENKTRLIAIPADTPAIVARDLELRASLQTIPIDALGSSAAGGRNTYQELMKYNVEQLLHATTVK